jgi:clostripain
MFYSDADNDLEEPAMNDLRQLLKLGSSPKVQLVMLCDRSELDSSEDGYSNERIFNQEAWDQALLLAIGKEQVETLEDWGEVNMADPSTLARFVKIAQEKFPAENYALIIGDHGSGWEGACGDDSSEDEEDQLTLAEISTALEGTPKLEVLGFDACLMATVETAVTLAPHARYLVASEELEPVLGWDYAAIANLVKERPEVDGEALSRIILTSFQRSFLHDSNAEIQSEGASITLSALDLDKIEQVQSALAKLSRVTHTKLESDGRPYWLILAAARNECEEYGADEGEEGSKAFDLLTLAREIGQRSTDRETREAAEALSLAVEQCVVDQVRGPARPGAHGLSIYFPNDDELLDDYAELPNWQNEPAWPDTLQSFLDIASERPSGLLSQLEVSSETVLPHEPVTVRAEVKNLEEVAGLYFVLGSRESGTLTVLGRREIHLTENPQAEWDGTWLTGPEGTVFPLESAESYRVAAERDGENVTLHMTGQELVMATRRGSSGVRQVHLNSNDTLDFLYPTIDDLGQRATATLEDNGTVIEERDQLDLSSGEVEAGDYEIGFLVVDHSRHWDLQVEAVSFGL